jgi:putative transposase
VGTIADVEQVVTPKVEKVRDGGRVVGKALLIAHGVHDTGRREILSIDVGEAETEAFWTQFLRGLVKRGLVGVQLASSDAHAGLKAAIAKVLGCSWQTLHGPLPQGCLGHARRDQHGLLGALIRPIFNADSLAQARDRLSEAVAHLDGRLGKVATMLEDAGDGRSARRRPSRRRRGASADTTAAAAWPVDGPQSK